MKNIADNIDLFFRGAAGSMVPFFGVVTSMQQEIEAWLRIGSLLMGLAVGAVTIWSIIRKAK